MSEVTQFIQTYYKIVKRVLVIGSQHCTYTYLGYNDRPTQILCRSGLYHPQ